MNVPASPAHATSGTPSACTAADTSLRYARGPGCVIDPSRSAHVAPPSADTDVLTSVFASSGCDVCRPPKNARRPSDPDTSAGLCSSSQSAAITVVAPIAPSGATAVCDSVVVLRPVRITHATCSTPSPVRRSAT